MSARTRLLTICLCAIALSGCVNRQQADDTLAKGCLAGVNAMMPEGETAGEIKEKSFSMSPEGPNMRHVKIKTTAADGWIEEDRPFECIFEETFGFLKSSHVASIYQLRVGDQIYGKSGNEIRGSFEDFTKITDAIREAMYK